MRILYLGNNWVGWQVLKWLKEQGEEIAGLVIHPPRKQKYAKEILRAAGLPAAKVFDGSRLAQPEVMAAIRKLAPDIGLSVLFDYILKPEFLSIFPQGVVNLHPAYLPYNRGQYPNVWSIIENTPAGVTLHYIDKGTDTGDIIARKEVAVEPVDTGETLYRKLERASVALFRETWPLVRSGKATRAPQGSEPGTCHRTKDVEAIDEIHLDETYVARDLINVLRARTFPPYPGAYFMHQGRRIYLRLQLLYEEQLGEGETR
jgi:methionyl-tRNA formyltransferase